MAKKEPPESLKHNPYADLLIERWNLPHNENAMYSCVFCARPGAGKSWSSLTWAWWLDRDSDDKPRFDIERVCFTATDFADWLRKGSQLPEGTAIILDDAGLVLYSREALSKVAIELSKAFQSMRYKNLIIILNLPSYGMLDANVRKLLYDYIEIVGRQSNQNLAKIQEIQLNPYSGDIYRHGIVVYKKTQHPLLKVPVIHREQDFIRIDKPPVKLVHAYEKRKKEYLDEWSEKSYRVLQTVEASQLEKSKKKMPITHRIFVEIKDRWQEYYDEVKQKFSIPKIMLDYKCNETAARLVANMLKLQLQNLKQSQRDGDSVIV